MTEPDTTPEGDPIETVTIWLDFDEGPAALSVDLTRFKAAMKRASESCERLRRETP